MLSVCHQHHERLDGNGYPQGLTQEQLSQWGMMAAICDVYDAITADRVYHKGMPPTVALKKMLEWSNDGQLNKELLYAFIRILSIYPVGTVVEMKSGRAAIVVQSNPIQQDKPIIKVIYSLTSANYIDVYQADLSRITETDEIISAIDPVAHGIDIRPFILS
jgi:HD-GYP domain-containing protein (c-di-GMP phosphodiesterase class II)